MIQQLPDASYILKLGENLGWCLTGTGLTGVWLEKLAHIMGLALGYSSTLPRLVFVRKAQGNAGDDSEATVTETAIRLGLPQHGWKADHLRPVWMWTHPQVEDIIFELPDSQQPAMDVVSMFHAVFPIYREATHVGGIPLHAALVERHGWGALLCGASGTGKSTCCQRFPGEWNVLCDDETLILPDGSGAYTAHPFPTWSEYWLKNARQTWKVERDVPLASIFFLEHSQTSELVPVGHGEAATRINQSALQIYSRSAFHLDKALHAPMRVQVFDNSCHIAEALPAFILRTSLLSPFWEEVEKILPRSPGVQ